MRTRAHTSVENRTERDVDTENRSLPADVLMVAGEKDRIRRLFRVLTSSIVLAVEIEAEHPSIVPRI